jgi:integration host factor subunit beta
VTKKDIVQAIAENLGRSRLEIQRVVDKTFAAIVDTVVAEGRIELRNFGVFEVRRRKARKARNPRTGKTVMVPEKCTVVFRPGQTVEELVERECRGKTVGHAGHRKSQAVEAGGQ